MNTAQYMLYTIGSVISLFGIVVIVALVVDIGWLCARELVRVRVCVFNPALYFSIKKNMAHNRDESRIYTVEHFRNAFNRMQCATATTEFSYSVTFSFGALSLLHAHMLCCFSSICYKCVRVCCFKNEVVQNGLHTHISNFCRHSNCSRYPLFPVKYILSFKCTVRKFSPSASIGNDHIIPANRRQIRTPLNARMAARIAAQKTPSREERVASNEMCAIAYDTFLAFGFTFPPADFVEQCIILIGSDTIFAHIL